ncbi:MAG: recombination protein O N-terminal domain-containing protein [Rickettsiales bacterium]|jgi:DNA repair protein RecO (recombination protein O)|nr:recombination protein O N-terminal domain-containing protein [Rickettsiales bacterium]
MTKIEDIGFIVFIRRYEEKSSLIKIFSKNNGLISGYLNNVTREQIGNLVHFTWTAKSITQLGTLRIENMKSNIGTLLNSKRNLYILENIVSLITNLLYENYLPSLDLFSQIENIIHIMDDDDKNVIRDYFYFENLLLNELGTGILFEEKRINEVYYVSPKTGLAVSKEIGEPYKNILFTFPALFRMEEINKNIFIECFGVIDYFLKKYLRENCPYKMDTVLNNRNKIKFIF